MEKPVTYVAAHTSLPSAQEAESGGSQIPGNMGLTQRGFVSNERMHACIREPGSERFQCNPFISI